MLVDLAKLQLFIRLSELKSLSKAAVLSGTTTSALSRQLTALELELGGRLFHRTGRGLELTDHGQQLVARAQQLIGDAEKLGEESRRLADSPSGTVRIGMLHSFIPMLVPELYRQTSANFPDIRLHCIEGSSGMLEEWISEGYVDIAFIAGNTPNESEGEFHSLVDSLHLIGTSSMRLTSQPTVKFSDLDGVPLVLPGSPNSMRVRLEQLARPAGITLNVAMEADSMAGQMAFVAAGHGCTINPTRAIIKSLSEVTFSAAKIVEPGIERTVSLSVTNQRPASRAVREVAMALRRILMHEVESEDRRARS